jgi:predicted acylesterase/phospholipase RssA
MTTSSMNTFELGLALAGAVSAGAYTAGVLDFLFQALNEWEKARTEPATPGHRVELQVVAGASAGAITGALGVVALAHGMQPRNLPTRRRKVFIAPLAGAIRNFAACSRLSTIPG